MSNSIMQAYTEYLVNINQAIYDSSMEMIKLTQSFGAEALKINPYKDVFGIMNTVSESTKSKHK